LDAEERSASAARRLEKKEKERKQIIDVFQQDRQCVLLDTRIILVVYRMLNKNKDASVKWNAFDTQLTQCNTRNHFIL